MKTISRVCYFIFLFALFAAGERVQALGQVSRPIPGGDRRIDLEICWAVYFAEQTLASPETSASEKAAAQAALDEKIRVIFDYSAPVPLLDLALFVNDARGEINWIYR